MAMSTSERLKKNIPKIMNAWEERALAEIRAAHHQESLSLRDSLPEYLSSLADVLSKTIDRTHARKRSDKEKITRIGKKHGSERASSTNYTMDQMIREYHILRQVLFDVMEEEIEFTSIEEEVVVCAIEQAVNDAATQFSESLKDYQENLSYTLVHDLRNPLTIIQASTELMLRKKEFSERKLQLINKNVTRIDKMITQLLDAGKKKANASFALEFKDCDLDIILKESIEGAQVANGDRFQYVSAGPCVGNWDENSLSRMIENLTTNAVKYGKVGSPIVFSLKQDATSASFSIHNDGVAIPPEEQILLFDKYRRSNSNQEVDGWGLGLSIVKGMVESHSGSITVTSENGPGTTFEITLPKDPELAPDVALLQTGHFSPLKDINTTR